MTRPPRGLLMRQHDWITIDVPDTNALPNAVFARAQQLHSKQIFALHSHRWNQLVYATSGTLVVQVAGSWYVTTPEQAIWVPAEVPHTTGALNGAAFRTLYIADDPGSEMPRTCTVFSVTPLMRELIIELERVIRQDEDVGYVDKLNGMIVEQLKRLSVVDFHLPWPHSRMLRKLCEALYANPADSRSLDDWGRNLGASARTLARRFEHELGISLREWRYRLRLLLALHWLGTQRSVTDIALALGYASTSAFTYMFRQEMGCSPSEWRRRQCG
jgi:AraC-like DNA-binding protein